MLNRSAIRLSLSLLLPSLVLLTGWSAASGAEAYDVVVYGGTSGGVAAAVQVRRMGKTVLIIEPGKHLGGLTSGGLGATDIGNKAAIGGISREFYQAIRKHYSAPGKTPAAEDAMWTFEPHVAEAIYRRWVEENGIEVLEQERLDLKNGVKKEGKKITSIRLESGKEITGRQFIDATYEGDLMALAGVSYHVGREANSVYNETLNGVQTKNARSHQMMRGVDPYVKKGDKSSGLLPGVHAGPPGEEGSGDKRVQAYNFRLCFTDVKENQLPVEKPAKYDEARYELLLRNFEAGETRNPWNPIGMPNRKTDTNNNFGFSTDNIGMNYDYPEGDYATRDAIFAEHLAYVQGLVWTLRNNQRVPEKVRAHFNAWGPCKDEFVETKGWSHQMYVREARRMISSYVMNQNDCQGRRICQDPVGLGAYNMDSHNVQRYVNKDGFAVNEGDIQVGVSPYAVSYLSIVPKAEECTNLFVPVCLSASHIAYGSIRMEPVFMVLGQSSATAACLAIDAKCNVQDVDFAKLKERLLADKQVLEWTGPTRKSADSIDPAKLDGIVIENEQAEKRGEWGESVSVGPFVGSGYLHDGNEAKGKLSLTYRAKLKPEQQGKTYVVRAYFTPNQNRATNVPVAIEHQDGKAEVKWNQRKAVEKPFSELGKFTFAEEAVVVISTEGTDGYVVADAVQLVPAE